jgi:hypothetical protein
MVELPQKIIRGENRCDGTFRNRSHCSNKCQRLLPREDSLVGSIEQHNTIKMSVEREKDKSKVHKLSLKGMFVIQNLCVLLTGPQAHRSSLRNS